MLLIFDENCRSKNYRLRRSITLTGRLRTLDSRHGTTGWTGTKRSCLVSTWNHRGESVESIFLGRTNRDAARCVLKGPRWDTGLPGRGKSGFLFAASMSGCYLSWIPVGYGDTARTSRYQAPPSRSFLLVASTRDMEFPPRRPDHRNSRCSPSFLGVIFNFLPDWFSPPNPPNTSPRTWNRAPAAPPTGPRVIKYRMNALLRGIAIFFPANLLTIGYVTSPFSVLFLWSTGSIRESGCTFEYEGLLEKPRMVSFVLFAVGFCNICKKLIDISESCIIGRGAFPWLSSDHSSRNVLYIVLGYARSVFQYASSGKRRTE